MPTQWALSLLAFLSNIVHHCFHQLWLVNLPELYFGTKFGLVQDSVFIYLYGRHGSISTIPGSQNYFPTLPILGTWLRCKNVWVHVLYSSFLPHMLLWVRQELGMLRMSCRYMLTYWQTPISCLTSVKAFNVFNAMYYYVIFIPGL